VLVSATDQANPAGFLGALQYSYTYLLTTDLELLNVVIAEKFTEARNVRVSDQLDRTSGITRGSIDDGTQ